MHKIQQLIQELCPDGVEFKKIGEVVKKTSNIRWADNQGDEFKYIDLTSVDRATRSIVSTQIIDSETAPSRAQQLVQEGDVIFGTTRPLLKRYTVIPKGYEGQICSTGFCVLRPDQSCILTNYLFHLLGTDDFYQYVESNEQGASYPAISDSAIKKFTIPIPPIPIQNEIVHILDLFTQLEAELEAELEGRKMQYTYYRDTLLNFEGKDVEWKTLGEVATIGTGSRNTNEAVHDGEFPFFVRSQNPLKIDEFEFDETAIITAGDGVGVGKVFHFVEGKYALHQRAYRIRVTENNLIPKFLFHFIRNNFGKYLATTSVHASVTSLRKPMFDKYPIPIPPLSEQARIVTILDKFDALVNDLSSGLPAEIQARRQQYEYYRNQLLTFKNRDHG